MWAWPKKGDAGTMYVLGYDHDDSITMQTMQHDSTMTRPIVQFDMVKWHFLLYN